MVVKVTSKRQSTFPVQELDGPSMGASDQIKLKKGPDELILQPRHIDYSRLGFLKDKINPSVEPFNLEKFRDKICNPVTWD